MNRLLQTPINRILKTRGTAENLKFAQDPTKKMLMNNVRFLEDPKNDRKLILIGTTNTSTLLAERTKQIIEAAKPDKVLVETDADWFAALRKINEIEPVRKNEEAQSSYPYALRLGHFENTPRNLYFKLKFYLWAFNASFVFPLQDSTGSWFRPGLETFNVAKWASDNKKEILYSGQMFNDTIIEALKNERQMYLVKFILRAFTGKNNMWNSEYKGYTKQVAVHGVQNWSESMDEEKLGWLINLYQMVLPEQKKILIDNEDERLFNIIYSKMNGKVNLALVNLWHLPGIEFHWKHTTQTETLPPLINPIGDFDIDEYMLAKNMNEYLRRVKAHKSKTEPAVTSDYLTQYNKQNTEFERERHVFFAGYDDPELEHGLYNDENKDVKNLPYKIKHH